MGLLEFGAGLYFAIAAFAIAMTYREQRAKGMTSPLFTGMGYVICLFWPLMIAAVLHAHYRRAA